LPQVPAYTQIVPGVVAPHRQAFRRTVAVLQYLIARVFVQWILLCMTTRRSNPQQPLDEERKNTVLYYSLLSILLWRWWPLVPNCHCFHDLDYWKNGNTWIFVVPIFLGVTGDLYQFVAWGDCVSIGNVLTGQLLGLCLAFGFTLGFRNYVPMSWVYGVAALSVWHIIQVGIETIQACEIK